MLNSLRLLGLLLLIWVSCWFPLGLLWGDPTLLLHPLQAPEGVRVTYLVLLYGGLLIGLRALWKAYPPGPLEWGSLGLAGKLWLLTVVATLAQRLCLWLGQFWQPPSPSVEAWASALFLAPALALVEEWVFRGYLFTSLRADLGWKRAALLVAIFFALVHLFRPGTLHFKLAYGLGLTLAALVLAYLVQHFGLLSAIAVHSAWISWGILDPPQPWQSHWWSGLAGEPVAGVCSWCFLLLLPGGAGWVFKKHASR